MLQVGLQLVNIDKALTSLAGKKRDDGRLSLLSAQLPLGLNMNKLHLQVGLQLANIDAGWTLLEQKLQTMNEEWV